MDYFKLFDLPVLFKVDTQALRRRFFEKSRESHPDHFANGSEEEQQGALRSSAELNQAFKTLSNEDLTMQYILQQKGLVVTDEKYALPPAFLMEVMELNEDLSEAQLDGSGTVGTALEERLRQFHEELYAPVASIIEGYKDEEATEADLLKVKEYYFKKKYLDRAVARLDQKS